MTGHFAGFWGCRREAIQIRCDPPCLPIGDWPDRDRTLAFHSDRQASARWTTPTTATMMLAVNPVDHAVGTAAGAQPRKMGLHLGQRQRLTHGHKNGRMSSAVSSGDADS